MSASRISDKEHLVLVGSRQLPPNMVAVALNLSALIADHYHITLVTSSTRYPKKLQEKIDVLEVSPETVFKQKLPYPIWSIWAAYRGCRVLKPDLLMNLGQPYPLGLSVIIVGAATDTQTVLRLTGDYFLDAKLTSSYVRRAWRMVFHEQLLNRLYRRADIALTVGVALKEKLIKSGWDESKLNVAPQPFCVERFEVSDELQRRSARQKLGFNQEDYIVLFVGRLSWAKGADKLVKIAREVKRRDRSFVFCAVGGGVYQGELEKAGVIVPGEVKYLKMPLYYKAADIFVYPTRRDSLPNVILEAIAASLPVIAAPVGEIPYYVNNTANRVSGFVEYLVRKDWEVDEKPDWFDCDKQREVYLRVLGSNR